MNKPDFSCDNEFTKLLTEMNRSPSTPMGVIAGYVFTQDTYEAAFAIARTVFGDDWSQHIHKVYSNLTVAIWREQDIARVEREEIDK